MLKRDANISVQITGLRFGPATHSPRTVKTFCLDLPGFRSTRSHLAGCGLGSPWPLRNFFLALGHSLCVCSLSGHLDSGLASGFSQVPVAMPTGNWSPRMSNDVMWLCSKVPTKTLLPLQHLITRHCCQVLLILTCLHRGFLPTQRRGVCVCVHTCVSG